MEKPKFFTVCFEGDMKEIKGDPFKIESVWGKPMVIGWGDIFKERDELEEKLEAYLERYGD